MKSIVKELKREQDEMITNLFLLAITKERTTSTRKRRSAKNRAKTVRKNLVLNERTLLKLK